MRRTMKALLATLVLVVESSQAGAATMTLDQLKDLVAGLGYEPSVLADNNIGITDQAKAKVTIYLQLAGDNSTVNIYAPFSDIADDKRADMPMAGMLKANNNSPFLFSISTVNGKDRIDLEATFDAATLNKKSLRKDLDALVAAIDENQPLWDQDQWKKGGEGKTLDEARAAFEAAWQRSPMRLDNAMYVSEPAPLYGGFTKRPTETFKKGEKLLAYLEPKSFAWKPGSGGVYDIGIAADMAILDTKGDLVIEKKDFSNQALKSHDKVQDFMLNMTLTINGLDAGDYKLRYTIRDLYSDKSATVLLPFKIVD